MDWLRSKVSGKRNRLKEDGFNLDITYITDRILAMSFPASGLEKVYRNDINKVANFLEERHSQNYRIYNLSNRSYNATKFKAEVKSYDWEDHHSPPILMLFSICQDLYEYLQEPNHVAVIHGNAGKGRTGTAIAGFLMYSGLAKNSQDAIRYYGRKRFSTGLGITQPSQIRYVRYFELVYKDKILSPGLKVLKQIKMETVPHMNGKSCKPYLEIVTLSNFECVYSGKNCDYIKTYKEYTNKKDKPTSKNSKRSKNAYRVDHADDSHLAKTEKKEFHFEPEFEDESKNHKNNRIKSNFVEIETNHFDQQDSQQIAKEDRKDNDVGLRSEKPKYIGGKYDFLKEIVLPQSPNHLILGDILFRVMHKGYFGSTLIGRIGLNTSFMLSDEMKFTIKDIDPVSIRKDDRYSSDFSLTFITQSACKTGTSQTQLSELCKTGRYNLQDEIIQWEFIHDILKNHKTMYEDKINYESACTLHYLHSGNVDYEAVIENDARFRRQSFRWGDKNGDGAKLCDNQEQHNCSEPSDYSDSEKDDEENFENELFDDDLVMKKTNTHNNQRSPIHDIDSPNFDKDRSEKKRQSSVTRDNTDKEVNKVEGLDINDLDLELDSGNMQTPPDSDFFDTLQRQYSNNTSSSRPRVVKRETKANLIADNKLLDNDFAVRKSTYEQSHLSQAPEAEEAKFDPDDLLDN